MGGVVIIGAGECGMRAAFSCRYSGYQGSITVFGDEPGMPYERPPLSKPSPTGVMEKLIATPQMLLDESIDLRCATIVTGIDRADRTIQLSNGEIEPYERLLLATGARPRALACPGGQHARVLRTREDANAIYGLSAQDSKIVIIGAGLIGLELAAVLTQRGARITVLESGPRPLGRNVPHRLADRIVDMHRRQGVEIHCGVNVVECSPEAVFTQDNSRFQADMIIAAVGVLPNAELAKAAGLRVDNGICVDSNLATDDPLIFAAGDCAAVANADGTHRRYETWLNAYAQGEVAGENLAGAHKRFETPVWFWSDQYHMGLQGLGTTGGTPSAIRAIRDDAEILFYHDPHHTLIGAAGLGPGNSVANGIKIAQRLIGLKTDPALMADPAYNMKKLLRPT